MANIKKLPSGKYQARYRDEARREHAKNFSRKRDAQRWLDEVTTSVMTGMYADPVAGKITFADFYRAWSTRQTWESTTRRGMDNTAARVTFGDVPLRSIRRSHVEAWVKAMSTELAATTVHTRMNNVRSVFRAAVRDRIIPSDPSAGVRLPRRRRTAHALEIPTLEDVGTIVEAAGPAFRPFVALCAFAGLRRGEAIAVQVGDIDFLRRTLHVTRQSQQGSGGQEIRAPKHGSERTVHLADDLVTLLSTVESHGPEQWLFAGSNGVPPVGNTILHHWRRTLKAAGLGMLRIHDLRHFYASGLIAQGCDVVTVQRALGHASATVTLGTYGHLWPTSEDRTRKAASALWSGAFADSVRTVPGVNAV
jgi:integrase